ncbi:MAG TPA: hypothetical protein VHV31_15415, partial [Nitrolancea sp.]|nr:hypothetical protein [Nitrolancea sp.]
MHDGTIRPGLVAELDAFRAPDQCVSSYYLDLDPQAVGGGEAVRIAVKNQMNEHRRQLDQLDVRPVVRHALRRDWEEVMELASLAVGERRLRGLACFAASESHSTRAVRLPWRVRNRAFFEDRFVLWPLRLLLQQADRYAICLTDEDEARLFLFSAEQIEEIDDLLDEVPG